jgi:hypothetical protein
VFTGRYGLNVHVYVIHVNLSLRLSQPISRQLIIAEVGVWCQVCPCLIFGGQGGTGTGFSSSSVVSPVSIIPSMFYSHRHLHASLTRSTHWRSLETFQKAVLFRKSGRV